MIDWTDETGALRPEQARAMEAAIEAALIAEGRLGDISLLVTGEEEIRAMNRDYRGMDRVTDVLSFPAEEGEALLGPPGFLGDICICLERAEEQAEEYGHSLKRELSFLAVHGALHLLGYDHMEPGERSAMEARQREILEGMGVTR